MERSPIGKAAAALGAASFLFLSTASAAAPVAGTVDPLVAISVLGTASSQAAVCTSGTASVAAAGAAVGAQAQAAQPGCVLPAVDAPPPVPAQTAAPVYVAPAAASTGVGILPLLLGLAAVAGGLALLLSGGGDDDDIKIPVSPN